MQSRRANASGEDTGVFSLQGLWVSSHRKLHGRCLRWTRGHRPDAEDLLGDAILLAIESAGVHLERIENPLAWLAAIIGNLGRDALRARKQRPQVSDSVLERERIAAPLASNEDAFATKHELTQLASALLRLTSMQREALIARSFGDSYPQIARRLHTSESNARKLVQLARSALRVWNARVTEPPLER
jgi:RNA polymerase sigma-70 factor (ECF subfamily)